MAAIVPHGAFGVLLLSSKGCRKGVWCVRERDVVKGTACKYQIANAVDEFGMKR